MNSLFLPKSIDLKETSYTTFKRKQISIAISKVIVNENTMEKKKTQLSNSS